MATAPRRDGIVAERQRSLRERSITAHIADGVLDLG
jgi:hypothetical protein